MNHCVFVGRLTAEPEIRYGNSEEQLTVARMSIAVDRPVRKGEDRKADFFRCVCFGKRAEFVAQYLRKGQRIAIQGRMQNESFTAADGNKVKYTEMVVNEINFADGKEDTEEKKEGTEKTSSKATTEKKAQAGGRRSGLGESRVRQADREFEDMKEEDEELPFH